jgi:catechol 2,3-dioxygenase-like lactoylglutathione lyase family enzyme
MDPRIHVITLGVKDFNRALAFYRDGLGWEARVQDDIAFFMLNGVILALYPRDRLAGDAVVPEAGTGFPGFTLACLMKDEAEVDSILETVRTLGARVLKPGQKTFWGGCDDILPTLMALSGKSPTTRS